jgi:prepilin-type processing-associated H-X9-DG protein
MDTLTLGFLHPGAMGISLAAAAQTSGQQAAWVAAGRSAATQARAQEQGLLTFESLAELAQSADIIVAICPPAAANEVAQQVLEAGFTGIYVDANAISPQRSRAIAARMTAANISFVDGSVIGPPAWQAQRTWLYLSGQEASRVASCFRDGPLETEVLGPEVGQASAIKMCYAARSKGTTALLSAIMAAAESLGVREALARQLSRYDSELVANITEQMQGVTAKAWRFAGEMEEIAATFTEIGQPDGFHLAAADIYQRLAHFKDADTLPELGAVIAALQEEQH